MICIAKLYVNYAIYPSWNLSSESPKMLSNFGIFWALTISPSMQAINNLIIGLTIDIADEVWLFLCGILANEVKV